MFLIPVGCGCFAVQVIAQPDERYEVYCRGSDFIREYIFPGGHLPSMGAMVEAARGTELAAVAVRDIGPDYAITLRAWRDAWKEKRQVGICLWRYGQRLSVHCHILLHPACHDAH